MKRTPCLANAAKDSHDRFANIEINYLLKRIEEYVGLAILASGNRTKIDSAFSRRFHFLISIRPRRKARPPEMTPDLEYPGVLVQEVPTCVRASVWDSAYCSSARARQKAEPATPSKPTPRRTRGRSLSAYARLGSTLTISGERNVPK